MNIWFDRRTEKIELIASKKLQIKNLSDNLILDKLFDDRFDNKWVE